MSYFKISTAILVPIMLLSAGSILMNSFQKDSVKTSMRSSVSAANSIAFETPVVKKDDGNVCRCFYEINVTSGFPHFISFRHKLSSSGTWTTNTWWNSTNNISSSFDVSAPYAYDFGVVTSQPCSGNVILACCNRPVVNYSGELNNVTLASLYSTTGCDNTCNPPF